MCGISHVLDFIVFATTIYGMSEKILSVFGSRVYWLLFFLCAGAEPNHFQFIGIKRSNNLSADIIQIVRLAACTIRTRAFSAQRQKQMEEKS